MSMYTHSGISILSCLQAAHPNAHCRALSTVSGKYLSSQILASKMSGDSSQTEAATEIETYGGSKDQDTGRLKHIGSNELLRKIVTKS